MLNMNEILYTGDSWARELFEIKQISDLSLLRLNSCSVYVVKGDHLDTADLVLLLSSAEEC